jgi:hypothetical protein
MDLTTSRPRPPTTNGRITDGSSLKLRLLNEDCRALTKNRFDYFSSIFCNCRVRRIFCHCKFLFREANPSEAKKRTTAKVATLAEVSLAPPKVTKTFTLPKRLVLLFLTSSGGPGRFNWPPQAPTSTAKPAFMRDGKVGQNFSPALP